VKTKTRPPHIRDLIDDDAQVICVEGFWPPGHGLVARGTYYKLSAPMVRQYPQFFAVVIPADTVLDEIER
jgi:hypothetical protein